MSVISIFEATPNRVRALTRLVAVLGAATREKLFAMTMPSLTPTDSQRDQFANLLRTTAGLGLITISGKAKVELASGITVDEAADPGWFLNMVERQLLSPADPGSENSDFPYALAWLMTQVPGTEIPWTSEQRLVMKPQMTGEENYEINSDGRFAMLCYWARFLGYATSIKLKKTVIVVPDPTAALDRMLDNILGGKARVAIIEFLDLVSKKTPVLEGGKIRTEVERRFIAPRPEHQLSVATTLALTRLERRGRLRLFRLDDPRLIWTTSGIAVDSKMPTVDRFSHVEQGDN